MNPDQLVPLWRARIEKLEQDLSRTKNWALRMDIQTHIKAIEQCMIDYQVYRAMSHSDLTINQG